MLRIIGGEKRGLRLSTPEGSNTRPTLDRVREALASILQGLIPHARVLELYAGTGAMGLEFLSRGAVFCTFLESNAKAGEVLRKNITKCGYGEKCRVIRSDVWAWLDRAAAAERNGYDLILADPPYDHGRDGDLLCRITPLLKSDTGFFVIQGRRGLQATLNDFGIPGNLILDDSRVYGQTELVFFRKSQEPA